MVRFIACVTSRTTCCDADMAVVVAETTVNPVVE
jgi:hypothetical protein